MNRYITRLAKQNPIATFTCVLKEIDVNISASTIRRRLEANGYQFATIGSEWFTRQSRKEISSAKKTNIVAKIMFTKTCAEWKVEKSRNIIRSDETKINLLSPKYLYNKNNKACGSGRIVVLSCYS